MKAFLFLIPVWLCLATAASSQSKNDDNGGKPKPKTTFSHPKELFAYMPKDSYPTAGEGGGLERAEANDWSKKNVVGRVWEWKGEVHQVTVRDQNQDGLFPVDVRIEFPPYDTVSLDFTVYPLDRKKYFVTYDFNLGDTNCTLKYRNGTFNSPYYAATAAEAKKLKSLLGKNVTFTSKVGKCRWDYYGTSEKKVNLELEFIAPPAIDGWLPSASK